MAFTSWPWVLLSGPTPIERRKLRSQEVLMIRHDLSHPNTRAHIQKRLEFYSWTSTPRASAHSVLRTSAEPTAAGQQTPINVSSRDTPTQVLLEHLRIISSCLQLLFIILFWIKWETKNNINQQTLLSADAGGHINSLSLETAATGSGHRVRVLSAGDEALQAEKPHLWGTLCYIT